MDIDELSLAQTSKEGLIKAGTPRGITSLQQTPSPATVPSEKLP
jgi:hypothetical protein